MTTETTFRERVAARGRERRLKYLRERYASDPAVAHTDEHETIQCPHCNRVEEDQDHLETCQELWGGYAPAKRNEDAR